MVCGSDAMLPVEVNMPTWRQEHFNNEVNQVGLKISSDLMKEVREMSQIYEFEKKQEATRRYNTKLKL